MSDKKRTKKTTAERSAPAVDASDSALEAIVQDILLGYSRADIVEALRAEGAVDPEGLFLAAMGRLETQTGFQGDPVRAWHLGARRLLYQKNMSINDYKSAHHVLKDMATIAGVYKAAAREANMLAIQKAVDSEGKLK